MPISKLIDPNSLKTNGSGRPSKYGEKSVQVSLSLPKSTIDTLKSKFPNKSTAEAVRQIIYDQVDLWEWQRNNP